MQVDIPADEGVASNNSFKRETVDMETYVLNEKSEPASNEMVWEFDLGKGSIGKKTKPARIALAGFI